MSSTPATRIERRQRPVSPHLTVYRLTPTMTMSIVHRITGGALYFGMLLIAWWIVAASASERQFALANGLFGSWLGLLVLLGFTWALIHHMLGGIRHFIWDLGYGIDKYTSTKLAWATLAGSLILTALIWAGAFLLRS